MSRSGRIGLSEYTAQRLAELRARRAEAELSDGYGASQNIARDHSSSALNASNSTLNSTESVSSSSASATSSPAKALTEATGSARPLTSITVVEESKESDIVTSRATISPSVGNTSNVTSAFQTGRSFSSEDRNGKQSSASNERSGKPSSFSEERSTKMSSYSSHAVYSPARDAESRSPAINGSGLTSASSNSKLFGDTEEDCIGFANLPEQVHRKAVKRGFDFTLMVVGETGLGKSTLISSMFFNNELYKDRTVPGALERLEKTVKLEKRYLEIEERGVKLRLTIVDTPGFNDTINSNQCWKPIEEYIYQQFDQYFKDESGLNRRNIKDNRVHCCLYFISPYGRGLRQIDIQFMLRLHNKVNIVPVVAKADTLTQSELQQLKARVLDEIEKNKIRIYELPQLDSDEDEDYIRKDQDLKGSVPFAVIGSNAIVEVNGKKVKGRVYPWGIVEVENPIHSDFTKLRQFLVSTHMQDLKDVTRDIHYENFRANYIQEHMNRSTDRSGKSEPAQPVSEADQLLMQREMELQRMQEMLRKMQAQLAVAKGPSAAEASDMTKLL